MLGYGTVTRGWSAWEVTLNWFTATTRASPMVLFQEVMPLVKKQYPLSDKGDRA